MTVKLKGQWKKDTREYNGLDVEAVRKELLAHPLQRRYAVVLLELSKVEELVQEGGTKVPTISVVHIEVTSGDDETVTKDMLGNLFNVRTGRQPQASLFDSDDAEARSNADRVLAGDISNKIETSCGALEEHEPHEGDGWRCDGRGTPGGAPSVDESLSIAEAGSADSGRPDIPAAPEFSDQTPDDGDQPKPRRGRK